METAQKIDPKLYTYRVLWSDEDQEFIGMCAEFPSLSWLEEDQVTAFNGIRQLVDDVVKEMEESGDRIPEPLSKKSFSGRFQVRIPESLHRNLTIKAAEENISLNRLVSAKLASV
jgi:predicted HicB family RNase H-like nuclease